MGKLLEKYEYWGEKKELQEAISRDPELRLRLEVLLELHEESQLRFAARPSRRPTLDYVERGTDYLHSRAIFTAPRRYRVW